MGDAVVFRNVGKRMRRYRHDRPTTLQEVLTGGFLRTKAAEQFWALRDVSFRIAPGSFVGVIGRNGAGKSTLLRLIAKIGRPEEGSVETHGRIGALLDLGAGLHPDLTGRENVYVSAVISGLTRHQVTQRFDEIVSFAELEEFIDSPLRTFSTGMQMRLAFSIAAFANPEILLIDEALAVGDLAFQQKCLERIKKFQAGGCTIVLVSHDETVIQRLCDEVIWLRSGELAAHDTAEVVINQYVAEIMDQTRRLTPATWPPQRTSLGRELRVHENRFGSLELEITSVRLFNAEKAEIAELTCGSPLSVEINYSASKPIKAPNFVVTITDEDGLVCYDANTADKTPSARNVSGSGRVLLHLERLDLNGGSYYVDIGVYERDWAYAYDYHWRANPLKILPTDGAKGIIRPPHRWSISDRS